MCRLTHIALTKGLILSNINIVRQHSSRKMCNVEAVWKKHFPGKMFCRSFEISFIDFTLVWIAL